MIKKMPNYRVSVLEVYYKVYEVKAKNPDCAEQKVYEGDEDIQVIEEDFDSFLKDSTEVVLKE